MKTKNSNLKKLIEEKGYELVHEGTQGNDLYFALDAQTGNVCLLVANEGSRYFKELFLNDIVVDKLFHTVCEDYKFNYITEIKEPTETAKNFINTEKFEILSQMKRPINDMTMTNEFLVRIMKEEHVVSIAHVAHIDNILTNINIVNLTYEEIVIFTKHIVDVARKIKENQESEENKNV